jgi:hypothetical protein
VVKLLRDLICNQLALTSPTNGGSVGRVRSRTQATEFLALIATTVLLIIIIIIIIMSFSST